MKPAGKIKRKNDILKEQRTQFEVPRKSCEEIVPEMVRLKKDKKHVQKHRLHIIRDIFVKCRMKNIKKHLKHIVELDKSDAIIPHGEVSKRIYENIFNAREFDLYGRLMMNDKKNVRKQEEIQKMAKYLGLKFEKDIVPDEIVKVPSLFGNVTDDLGG
jgi:transcription initiation factor TFIIIB Brf1 subunit/transcription initiation factor TFIIB